ncbi:hypothetical protein NEFER03_0706 [Nematocida sp. LUAm3]|nr:hypothetical protein NEFER03_0706 [Nematocida sp. LUAm3]KAI5175165.1 hypothetical protein NEFER02_1126 [Nematocida sp. LUAm2]KAI5178163.1 hypothetical protein NEFER01_1341 [Nematocida sp. LUAm1]
MKEKLREEFFPSLDIDLDNTIRNNLDLENIPLIEYPSKEDEILRDLSIDETVDEEINVSKIYQNELNELNELDPHYEGTHKQWTDVGLNSDVDNDICMENIKRIHKYLDDDAQAEREMHNILRQYKN